MTVVRSLLLRNAVKVSPPTIRKDGEFFVSLSL